MKAVLCNTVPMLKHQKSRKQKFVFSNLLTHINIYDIYFILVLTNNSAHESFAEVFSIYIFMLIGKIKLYIIFSNTNGKNWTLGYMIEKVKVPCNIGGNSKIFSACLTQIRQVMQLFSGEV